MVVRWLMIWTRGARLQPAPLGTIPGLEPAGAKFAHQVAQNERNNTETAPPLASAEAELASQHRRMPGLISSTSRRITVPFRRANRLATSPRQSAEALVRRLRSAVARTTLRLTIRQDAELVAASGMFDRDWYVSQHPDVAQARTDPVVHYLRFGAFEGRDPSPLFDSDWYLRHNRDVANAGVNPLVHYLRFGRRERRAPRPPSPPKVVMGKILRPEAFPLELGRESQQALIRRAHAGKKIGAQLLKEVPLLPKKEAIERLRMARVTAKMAYKPLISILMPTYNTPAKFLAPAVDSVLDQAYPHWELCITDDGSSSSETIATLDRYRSSDERIKIQRSDRNQGIAAATNASMAVASGDFIAMVDHDDELLPDALFEVATLLNGHPDTDVVYTDQEFVDTEGTPAGHFYKPDWSPQLFRGVMYIGHLLVVRRTLAVAIGGFDSRFDKVQDFEFMLRVSEHTTKIRHIPKILYHWRKVPGSVAFRSDQKGKIEPLQAAAVNEHLARSKVSATALPNEQFAHRLILQPNSRAHFPTVSLIVRAPRNLVGFRERLETLTDRAQYPALEVIVVPEHAAQNLAGELSGAAATIAEAQTGLGTASSYLRAVHRSSGEYLILMDGRLEACSDRWLEHLLFHAELRDSACVMPLILEPDSSVLHAGLILGMAGAVGDAMHCWPPNSDGYAGSLSCAREVAAVADDCVMISREMLEKLGNLNPLFDSDFFRMADLSVRALAHGKRNICTPRAVFRYTAWDNGKPATIDRLVFADVWGDVIRQGDPFHNPNFSLRGSGFSKT